MWSRCHQHNIAYIAVKPHHRTSTHIISTTKPTDSWSTSLKPWSRRASSPSTITTVWTSWPGSSLGRTRSSHPWIHLYIGSVGDVAWWMCQTDASLMQFDVRLFFTLAQWSPFWASPLLIMGTSVMSDKLMCWWRLTEWRSVPSRERSAGEQYDFYENKVNGREVVDWRRASW